MKCEFCSKELNNQDYCSNCKKDIRAVSAIKVLALVYYNQGLEDARRSMISQAIVNLKKSIALNSRNINAINLLGLCHYRKGEYTKAFREWIYSLDVQPKKNEAQIYMTKVAKRKNFMSKVNASYRGYNKAILHIEQDQEELAIMQLQQVVERLPEMIEAQLLLALLRIQDKDFNNAKKGLRKVLVIDIENETALKYLDEIEKLEVRFNDKRGLIASKSATVKEDVIVPTTSFKEYSIGRTVVDVLIGGFLGVMLMIFLVLPAIRDKNTDANKSVLIGQSKYLEDLKSEISTLKDKNNDLEKKNKEAVFKEDKTVILEAAKSLQKSAEKKYDDKDYKGARDDFRYSIILGNDGQDIYFKLVEVDVRLGDIKLAEQDAKRLKEKYPDAPQNADVQELLSGKKINEENN